MCRSIAVAWLLSVVTVFQCDSGTIAGQVLESAGHLAVRETGSQWRMLQIIDEFPPRGDVRTSAAGPVRGEVAGADIVIGANSSFQLDQTDRHLGLVSGRVHVQSTESWSIGLGDHSLELQPDVQATIAAVDDAPRIELVSGSVALIGPNDDRVTYRGPLTLIIGEDGVQTSEPSNVEEWTASILNWTTIRPSQGLGQLIVKDPQSGSPTRMEIARCHVNVVLRPPVALVQLDQSFFNPAHTQQEGTFVFNLPPGASVSRFAMFVTPDELIEGELIERKRASNIYESIVRRRRDPAILEQIGDNLFRMRVFPIFARDTKRILLDFTLPLKEQNGRYKFDLPLMSDLKPIWDFRISGSIHPPVAPESIISRLSPHLEFQADDSGVVRFSSEQTHVYPPQRLDLQYAAPQDRVARWDQYTPEAGSRKHQYFVASLPTEPVPDREPSPCDLMIVVDTSGSMQHLHLANEAIRTILHNLPPDCRFQLACIDDALRPLTTDWRSPSQDHVRQSLTQLEQQVPLGISRLSSGLRTAVDKLSTSRAKRRQLIYIGDGHATRSPTNWSRSLLPSLQDIAVSTVRTSDSPTGAVELVKVARHTGGRVFRIDNVQDLESLFRWTLGGCSAGLRVGEVRVEGSPHAEVFTDPSVMPGDPLYVYGRCAPRETLSLAVSIGGEEQKQTFSEAGTTSDEAAVFTGRLWAQRMLEARLGARTEPTTVEKGLIVKLSQEWSLLSPYTAFLVLETEADYERWNIDRQLRRRYWKPAEALPALPLPERLAGTTEPERTSETEPLPRVSRANLDDGLESAREALENGEPALAMRRLLPLRTAAEQWKSQEFKELLNETNRRLEHDRILGSLGIHRRLFDLGARLPMPSANLLSSLIGAGAISPDFLSRHPAAAQMMKRVSLTDLTPRLTEFAELIRRKTGWNVLIDQTALTDVGIPTTEELDLRGIREMTVRHLLYHALQPLGLTYVQTPHLVTITTNEISDEKRQTRVYPVVDLIRTDVRPKPESLSHPYSDLNEAFRRKTEAALDKPVSVDFEGMTLTDFRDWLDGHLKTNLLIDEGALTDVGIPAEREVIPPLKLQNVPLRIVMDTVLDQYGLSYEINRELVKITTVELTDERMETRLYSMVGIVYEVPRELIRERIGWQGGTFFGGGGFEGGGLGGGLGGGGFGGFGGGGFGGGIGWGMDFDGFTQFGETEAGISVIDPLDVPDDSDSAPDPEPAAPVIPEGDGSTDDGGVTEFESQSIIDSVQMQTEGQWEDIDGIGGSIDYYAPAMALIVRQTDRVHREVAEELKLLRELPVAGERVHPARFPVITEDTPAGWDMQDLIYLIEEQTEGQWEDIDGIGGDITEHLASMSLMISQTGHVHDEIDQLLTQLRRAIIENRHRLQQLERGLPMSDSPLSARQVNLTDWPVVAPPHAEGTDKELELLSVRKAAPEGSVRYRQISGQTIRELAIRHDGSRLEYETDHLLLRADGDQGAIRYSGLTRVELDAWGEAIRRFAESALPWLPHVSNERLAALYDVRSAAELDDSLTLELRYSADPKVRIQATFERTSGQPSDWQVFVGESFQYRLEFSQHDGMSTIKALDADGDELQRWEVIETAPQADVPAVDEHRPQDLVVNRRDRDDVLLRIHRELEQYRYQEAMTLIDTALEQQPGQALLNFLLAWTCEQGRDFIPDAVSREQEALAVVIRSEAEDLIVLIQAGNFPSADQDELLAVLKETAQTSRSVAILEAIVELSLLQNDNSDALVYQTRILDLAGEATLRRRLRQIDLLAANGRLAEARESATTLSTEDSSVITLAELGDLFGKHRDLSAADAYFARALELADMNRALQSALMLRQANWHQGAPRWRLLVKVADRTGEKKTEWNSPLQSILREATIDDANVMGELAESVSTPAIEARLLEQQARLTDDPALAAEICRQLLENRRASESSENWMLRRIAEAGDHAFVISFFENRLRNGRRLPHQDLSQLADSYEAVGNTDFALRARRDENQKSTRSRAPGGGGFF